jgi:very-short-patch-repair endonuclease
MNLDFARAMRHHATPHEHQLWQHLRAGRLHGFKFKRQQPLGNYIVDFVCFQTRLIVEADGGQHADQTAYDTQRDQWLISQKFKVLRYWNNDIAQNLDGVLEQILAACLSRAAPALQSPPSPQPLPREGGGANEVLPDAGNLPPSPLAGEGLGERGFSLAEKRGKLA